MDPLYWRLVYADDHVEDEPDDNRSILYSRPDPIEFHLCRPGNAGEPARVAIHRIPLFEDDVRYMPIFYRRRSMAVDDTATRLDATIVGRGAASKNLSRAARRRIAKHGGAVSAEVEFNYTLWASFDGQRLEDCPMDLVDQPAIERLLTVTL